MAIQLLIGYIGEGNTDERFIPELINKVFCELAVECHNDVMIEDVRSIEKCGGSFEEVMLDAAKQSYELGLSILCVHSDADSPKISTTIENKFDPFLHALSLCKDTTHCKNIVKIIPIQETEAWMLADKKLFKEKINAKGRTDNDLGINKQPELFSDPKGTIEEAIRIAQSNRPKRRRRELSISDLYDELGRSISIERLQTIPSFCAFEESAKEALKSLGYIRI